MTRPSRSALIVSDSAPLRRYISASLAGARISGVEASTGQQAMDLMSERSFELCVVDLDMPSPDGLAMLAKVFKRSEPSPALVGFSRAPGDAEKQASWSDADFAAVLPKPFQPADLVAAAKAALESKAKSSPP